MKVYQVDEATKLYTEDFLTEALDDQLTKGKNLVFAHIKVEFLKQDHKSLINMALKDISRIVRNQIRNIDFAVKLKESILIIFPGSSRSQAERVIERIIKKIEEPNFLDGYTVLTMPKRLLTDMFTYPEDAKTKEEVLKKVISCK